MINKTLKESVLYHSDKDYAVKNQDKELTVRFLGIKIFTRQYNFNSSVDKGEVVKVGFKK